MAPPPEPSPCDVGYVCSLQAKGSTRDEAEILVKVAAENCNPPFDIDTALEKVVRVYDKYESPITNTSGFVDTDMANAERFARLHADAVFHTPECGWLITPSYTSQLP